MYFVISFIFNNKPTGNKINIGVIGCLFNFCTEAPKSRIDAFFEAFPPTFPNPLSQISPFSAILCTGYK
jgi:hypothetical protein